MEISDSVFTRREYRRVQCRLGGNDNAFDPGSFIAKPQCGGAGFGKKMFP